MAAVELAVPVWATDVADPAASRAHRRALRFTLIVLGESVLAATLSIQQAIDAGSKLGDLAGITGGGILVVFSMWWLVAQPTHDLVHHARDHMDALSSWCLVPVGLRPLRGVRLGLPRSARGWPWR